MYRCMWDSPDFHENSVDNKEILGYTIHMIKHEIIDTSSIKDNLPTKNFSSYSEIYRIARDLKIETSCLIPISEFKDPQKTLASIRASNLFKRDRQLIARLTTDGKNLVISKTKDPRPQRIRISTRQKS